MFLNTWGDAAHESWPEQIDDHLFLGDVVNLVGDLLFPGEWRQADMLSRPITLREVPVFRERPIQPPVSIARSDLRLAPVPSAEQQLADQRRRHDEEVAEITGHNAEAAHINAQIGPSRARAETVRKAIMAAGRRKLILTAYQSTVTRRLEPLEPAVWAGDEAVGLLGNCVISGRAWMAFIDQQLPNFIFVQDTGVRNVNWQTVGDRQSPPPLGAPTPAVPTPKARSSKFHGTRWDETAMTEEILSWTKANACHDREAAWRHHFDPLRSTHGWDNRSFRAHWPKALGSAGRPGKRPKSAQS